MGVKPSTKELKYWKPIVDICVSVILQQPPRTANIEKKLRINLRFPGDWKKPDGWPRGKLVAKNEDKSRILSYPAESILLWLWERRLSPWCASDIYKSRHGVLLSTYKMEVALFSDIE